MTPFAAVGGSPKRQRASQAAGFAAVTIAVAALTGLWASLPVLSSWGSGFPVERPLGALCLTALGLALMHPGRESRIAFAVGLTAAAIAALALVLVLFNVELGINRWASAGGCGAPGFVPGRKRGTGDIYARRQFTRA
jgi:hypothetical protein